MLMLRVWGPHLDKSLICPPAVQYVVTSHSLWNTGNAVGPTGVEFLVVFNLKAINLMHFLENSSVWYVSLVPTVNFK